jgi:hypothetical protein
LGRGQGCGSDRDLDYLPDAEFFGWIQNSFVEEGILLPDSKFSCFTGYGYGFKSNFQEFFKAAP